MATKIMYLHSIGPFPYDDTIYSALQTDGQLLVEEPSVLPNNVVRRGDLATATVTSLVNIDGTLTISGPVGDVTIGINLANANTWTARQSFMAKVGVNTTTPAAELDVSDAYIRAADNGSPPTAPASGKGLELVGIGGTGYILSYNRGTAAYQPINISGSTVRLYGGGQTGAGIDITTTGNVGIGVASPNANAILDVVSTTQAFMPPRMTTTQRNAVASPTAGMVVYNSTTNKLNVYTTAWEAVTSV